MLYDTLLYPITLKEHGELRVGPAAPGGVAEE